jgi:hypothetical protein
VALRTNVTPDRRHAAVRVAHLSYFRIFGIDVGDALQALKRDIFDGITGSVLAEAQRPRCGNETGARTDGFSIASDPKDTVYWCFGVEGGNRVLRVVNNRRYPLAVRHPGLTVVDAGQVPRTLAQLGSRLTSGRETIISPRDAVVFGADLLPGATGGISTELDGVGWSLYQLQVGVESALALLTRFGLGSGEKSIDVIDKIVGSANCATTIGQSGGDLIAKCFNPKQLLDALGWKGLVIAPVMVSGAIVEFFQSAFNALFDQFNHRDSYRVVISRKAAAAPPHTTTTPALAPPPSRPRPSTTASTGFNVGDDFDTECQVAWPTAPTRTTREIDMTMQCLNIPSDYLLVAVAYPDPNLPVTPSTGRMHVHGRIVDIAQSEYGYKELVVLADRITLP